MIVGSRHRHVLFLNLGFVLATSCFAPTKDSFLYVISVYQRNRDPVGSLKLKTYLTNFQPVILQKYFFTKTENFKIMCCVRSLHGRVLSLYYLHWSIIHLILALPRSFIIAMLIASSFMLSIISTWSYHFFSNFNSWDCHLSLPLCVLVRFLCDLFWCSPLFHSGINTSLFILSKIFFLETKY